MDAIVFLMGAAFGFGIGMAVTVVALVVRKKGGA